MKSMNELMSELGFNKSASIDTQKAFIKNLIQAAKASQPRGELQQEPKKTQIKEQLEFDLEKVDRVS